LNSGATPQRHWLNNTYGATTEYLRENFVKIQDTIEAINRAIADEEVIEGREPRSSSSTPIGFGNR
jgi:hypothetical protein